MFSSEAPRAEVYAEGAEQPVDRVRKTGVVLCTGTGVCGVRLTIVVAELDIL